MSKSKNTKRYREADRDNVRDKSLNTKGRQKRNWTKAWLEHASKRNVKEVEEEEDPVY